MFIYKLYNWQYQLKFIASNLRHRDSHTLQKWCSHLSFQKTLGASDKRSSQRNISSVLIPSFKKLVTTTHTHMHMIINTCMEPVTLLSSMIYSKYHENEHLLNELVGENNRMQYSPEICTKSTFCKILIPYSQIWYSEFWNLC